VHPYLEKLDTPDLFPTLGEEVTTASVDSPPQSIGLFFCYYNEVPEAQNLKKEKSLFSFVLKVESIKRHGAG
jgi:hypothetical protein